MKEIIVFGAGKNGEIFLERVRGNQTKILFFVDNDKDKQSQLFHGYNVFSPDRILDNTYDFVIVASLSIIPITEQLVKLGVPLNKIIPFDYQAHLSQLSDLYRKGTNTITKKPVKDQTSLSIALLNYNFSNQNGWALYKNMPSYIKDKYKVDLIEHEDYHQLAKYDVICSSNHRGIYDEHHINIELWHGFSFKKKGAMLNHQFSGQSYQDMLKARYTDLVMSYSELHSTCFNSCYPSEANRYKLTGMPRNDFLFNDDCREKLSYITNTNIGDGNVIVYLPTWRKGQDQHVETQSNWDQLFDMFVDEQDLGAFLEEHNTYLFVKLHPFEYNKFKDLTIFEHDRINLLNDELLINQRIHLYEVLGATDLLITDYSSVYFDLLLLDTPTIFVQPDKKEYEKNRGFLVEPYDYFTVGPKVNNYSNLKAEISYHLLGNDDYEIKRKELTKLIHKYNDNQSSLRVWSEIDRYLCSLNQ
ncbi:CDP-glycerol glycerophosphotransferase (TagB/SpsB family) [Natronobacillus azotifigens]|uniref:CDP-glycerol glycerophosphotransferase family protein n=1 Tax=Natronobacillus azotifigens TaxID=472978 RepID=A0A9J6R9X0_9BACI|nr:CDP-glycerol glycerophosphotransferase family protein [Natronobacillus azotifigens]MCZ0702107.1 CDP-glycerol glycerophosphotransferase family protein [Natronobacillus azotifigens]